jgi:hypothetical protein
MRALAGAVLILAAAILYATGILTLTAVRVARIAYGGNPFFFEADYATIIALALGTLGLVFLSWGAITDCRRSEDQIPPNRRTE